MVHAAVRQCILRTDPPNPEYPIFVGGSGFLVKVHGRTCFFTARHIFADSQGIIDIDRLHRLIVFRKWGDPTGHNLIFESGFGPQFGPEHGTEQLVNDALLLICSRSHRNETDDSLPVIIDDYNKCSVDVPPVGARLHVFGFPNIPGLTPVNYDERRYRPNHVTLKATFSGMTDNDRRGIATITEAIDSEGNPFPLNAALDGMSGSLVLAHVDNDNYTWAGMLVESGGGTIRFILAHCLRTIAQRCWQEKSDAGRW